MIMPWTDHDTYASTNLSYNIVLADGPVVHSWGCWLPMGKELLISIA
jgi:hypothetical protein